MYLGSSADAAFLELWDAFYYISLYDSIWCTFVLEINCVSIFCSSCSHAWDAFQLADASFRLYCENNNDILPANSEKLSYKQRPQILGDPPKIDIVLPEATTQGEEESPENVPEIKIYDDDVTMRFLVCGVPCALVGFDFALCMFETLLLVK